MSEPSTPTWIVGDEISDLVDANHVLADHGVLDAYGHVSVRAKDDPSTFHLAWSKSPMHVAREDVMRFDLSGEAVGDDTRAPYLERFIHSAIYEARPDVGCVIHAHTEAILPFTITDVPLKAVTHSVSDIGHRVPRWDIRESFGDTDLMVTTPQQGRDLAGRLGSDAMVLMAGHGFALAGPTVVRNVSTAVYVARNARVLLAAMQLGGSSIRELSDGEIAALRPGAAGSNSDPDGPALRRGWNLWVEQARRIRSGQVPQ